MTILLFLLSTIQSLNSAEVKKKSWVVDLAETIDINAFVRNLKFEAELKVCKIDDAHDSLVGVELHHMDIFIFTETVREKGYVIMMQSNILEKKKSESGGATNTGLGKIMGMGSNRGKKGTHYINMAHLPIMGMLTESLGLDGIACFHPKQKFFFYASSIDPTAVDYMQYLILIDTLQMFNINGILSMIVDCVAYEGYSLLNDKSTNSSKYFTSVIDSYQHSFGCSGAVAIGGDNQSSSPLVNGMMTSATLLKIMSRNGYSIQQSKRSLLNKGRDVTCGQLKGPFIKSQFTPQMMLPVASKVFEMGSTPAKSVSFKDDQSTQGDTAMAWWVRKDFISYSGTCSW